jgi:DNA polymerase-3 subunit delta
MGSRRTLVVLRDLDLFNARAVGEGDRAAYAALFADLPDYACLVLLYDLVEFKIDARMKKLAAAVKDHGQMVRFQRQSQSDLVAWIQRRLRALEHSIDRSDAQYLIFLCGDLMQTLIPEIEKIGSFAPRERVTREDIDAVAIPQLDAVVFQVTNAIADRDFDRASKVLGELLQRQEAPMMILAVLGKQFRQLLCAHLLGQRERGDAAAALMKLWGLRSNYGAQQLLAATRRLSASWCRNAVRLSARTDLAMKSTGADARELLLSLLLELSVKGR